jgi:ADP-heptose:LPS heptosyltransferase
MNHKTNHKIILGNVLKKLDPYLARPAVIFIYLLRWCMAFICLWRKPQDEVLVVRPGGMGDLIAAQIALEDLGMDPRRLKWLIEKRSESWAKFQGLPYRCYDSGFFSILWQWGFRFKTVINTEQLFGLSQSFALFCTSYFGELWAFSTNRAGLDSRRLSKYDPRETHETMAFRNLFKKVLKSQFSDVTQQEQSLKRERKHLAQPGLVVVGIGGLQNESRRYSLDEWSELIQKELGQSPFILISAPVDFEFSEKLANRFGKQAQVFQGSFQEVCSTLQKAEKVLTIDSGFLHICSYFGVPSIVVFTSGQDKKWAPLAKGSRVLKRDDLSCQPCTLFGQVPPCPHDYACRKIW